MKNAIFLVRRESIQTNIVDAVEAALMYPKAESEARNPVRTLASFIFSPVLSGHFNI